MHLVRALHSRNYRLFFSGQGVSLVGTWMTRVAMLWLVWEITHSALIVGAVSFASRMPAFLLAPVAGVWVDRLNRRNLLIGTQAAAMVQSLGLAAAVFLPFSNHIKIVLIFILCIFQGLINAFDMPTRQAFVVEMVEDKNDLGNAIALNSSMVNMARMVGPSAAGLLVAAVGTGWCFLIDGFSYIAVIISLLMMHVAAREIVPSKRSSWEELHEGWQYVSTSLPIRTILLLVCIVNLVGMPYRVLLPEFADRVLRGGSGAYGFLLGATAVGALIGAFILASRNTVLGLGKQIPITAAVFGLGLMLFGATHITWLALLLMAVIGFGSMLTMASCNTLLQTILDEDKRGRVMSFYIMSGIGMVSIGGLVVGEMSHLIGTEYSLMACGVLCVAGAGWFAKSLPQIRQSVRPIYLKKGILSEVAPERR